MVPQLVPKPFTTTGKKMKNSPCLIEFAVLKTVSQTVGIFHNLLFQFTSFEIVIIDTNRFLVLIIYVLLHTFLKKSKTVFQKNSFLRPSKPQNMPTARAMTLKND